MHTNSVLTISNQLTNEIKFEMQPSLQHQQQQQQSSIGLSIDQNQLLQITQLMNELQQNQQQQNDHLTITDIQNQLINNNNQTNQNQQMEILVQPSNHHHHQTNNVILSPNSLAKLDQQIQFQTNQNTNIQQLFMQQIEPQQQQQQQNQVHTIMLNGQPALFIPASAAMSSNILNQMLTTQTTNTSQNQFDLLNATSLQLNTNDYSQLLTNSQLILTSTDDQNLVSSETRQHENNNQEVTTDPQILCKLENIEPQIQDTQQQIIMIQPDGNFTFQTIQSIQQQLGQQQQQENLIDNLIVNTCNNITNKPMENNITNTNTNTNKITNETTTNNKKKYNKTKSNNNDEKNSKSNKNSKNKVSHLLSESNNKIRQVLPNVNPIQLQSSAPQSNQPVQVQIIRNSDQQWIIINNDSANMMPTSTITTTTSTQSSTSTNTNPLEVDLINGLKKKRKACDCPNCIKYKQSGAPKDEAYKKRTHKCHKCNKEYNKTSHLRAHLRAHDNYRPYVCDFKTCGKSFTRSDELKRHKRIHNDDRNFPCQICKKKFLRSDHLSKHLLVHNKSSGLNKHETKKNSIQQQLVQEENQSNINEQILTIESIGSSLSASSAPTTTELIV